MNQSEHDPSRPRTFWEFIDFRFWHLVLLLFCCILAFVGGMIFMRSEWPKDPAIRQILQYQYEEFKHNRDLEKQKAEEAEKKRIHEEKIIAEKQAVRAERDRIHKEQEQKAQNFLDRITNEIYITEIESRVTGRDRRGQEIRADFLKIEPSPGWENIKTKWKHKNDTLFYVMTDEYVILIRNTKACDTCQKILKKKD